MGSQDEFADAIMRRLRTEGVPQGTWLVEIEQVRTALGAADELLRRMADAIMAGLPPLN